MAQSTQNNGQLLLGYWAIRGLVQPIRLALHYTKTPFTDKRYPQGGAPDFSREKWLSEKQNLGLDFPNLPYLMDDDLKITQSKAILYYLGRKLNLMGATPEEEARVMMLCAETHDLHVEFATFCYGPNGDSSSERKRFVETTLSEHVKKFDDYLSKTKSKFAVGNQMTVADFQLYDNLDFCFVLDNDNVFPEKFPHVKHYLQEFREIPELKQFIIKSEKELPMNGASAKLGGKVIERTE